MALIAGGAATYGTSEVLNFAAGTGKFFSPFNFDHHWNGYEFAGNVGADLLVVGAILSMVFSRFDLHHKSVGQPIIQDTPPPTEKPKPRKGGPGIQ